MFKLNLKSKLIVAVMLIMGVTAFISCEKDDLSSEATNQSQITTQHRDLSFKKISSRFSSDKELITINNIGEAHNYLLGELEKNSKLRSDNKTLGDIFDDMETILKNSEKYSFKSNIETGIPTPSDSVLKVFSNIKLDARFFDEFKSRFNYYIKGNKYLSKEVVEAVLNSEKDFSIIDTTNLTNKMSGYTSIIACNNIYPSSIKYWENNIIDSNYVAYGCGRTTAWVDVAGGLLGATCSWGVMTLLLGAAASDAYIRCVDLAKEMDAH